MLSKFFTLSLIIFSLSAFATDYGIVKNKSSVKFNINKFSAGMMVDGKFSMFEGNISIDSNEIKKLTGKIFANSIDTGKPKRDGHLRSGDFFAANSHPFITFKNNGTKKFTLGKEFSYQGTLTMRGKTKPITLKLTIKKNTHGGYIITGTSSLNRYDYGVNWNNRQDKKEESLLETISNFAKGLGDKYVLDKTVNIFLNFYLLPKA